MSEQEVEIAPEIYNEILSKTEKRNYIRLDERIARKTLVELVKAGRAAFLFIRDDETRDYWTALVNEASAEVKKKKEAWRLYDIKQSAWDRLSLEDRKTLGIRKPTKPRFERI